MRTLSLLLLAGCPAEPAPVVEANANTDTDVAGCYPAGSVEPMALNEVLSPYSWPAARRMSDGATVDLDLEQVACDTDPDIEWSSHDVLVFVSIPAW